DVKTDKCIRQAYVQGGSSTIISQIPQKMVYLKLAFGKDWMELQTDSVKLGKFTRNVSYEKSVDVFDFGDKHSREIINYQLEINVQTNTKNNFITSPIDEKEFMK
ncbi:hypothetical protein VPJ68_03150, partial [Parabacteroides distasonis]